VEVVRKLSSEHEAAPMPAEETPVQPKNSRARVEETRDSVTLTLPPAGFVGTTRASLVFAIAWCAFMAIVTGIPLATGKLRHAWPVLLFGSLFWFIGIAMLLGSINMARRRALLIATTDDLRIAQQTLFGKKTWSWSRAKIEAIRVDGSGTKINNRPVLELQIHPRGERAVGLFGGRDETELQWIATVLRNRLRVPAFA
jgi:hypothetical protein